MYDTMPPGQVVEILTVKQGGCPQQLRQVVNNGRPVTATPGKGATTCMVSHVRHGDR